MKIKWKEIFRPTKAKIILPAVLCLFFIIAISLNYYYADKIGNFNCGLQTKFYSPGIRANLANDTIPEEKILEDLTLYLEENQISEALGAVVEFNDGLLSEISPFYIELFTAIGEEGLESVSIYSSEEVFQCLRSASRERSMLLDEEFIEYGYEPVPFYTILLTALFLIFEGYIISCLIAFIYNKKKKK